MKTEPEFNNGFVTALALFYGHLDKFRDISRILKQDGRIYAATDHLCDLQIPKTLSLPLKRRIKKFIKYAFSQRLENISEVEGQKIFDECKEILTQIDKECFGLEVIVNYA